jgi:hypothetical protein
MKRVSIAHIRASGGMAVAHLLCELYREWKKERQNVSIARIRASVQRFGGARIVRV